MSMLDHCCSCGPLIARHHNLHCSVLRASLPSSAAGVAAPRTSHILIKFVLCHTRLPVRPDAATCASIVILCARTQLRHPHVIQFKEAFLTSEHVCIAMEYATGGSLFHYVQKQSRLKEAVARWFFQQLVIGCDYCHKRGVANRDIKLENTLLQKVNGLPLPLLKICDFGYSKADFKSAAKSKVGTLTYMAPEVLVNRDGRYDGKVGWSCWLIERQGNCHRLCWATFDASLFAWEGGHGRVLGGVWACPWP